ncbi:Endonuclease/exonuclease/phosphatase [Crepidotus variabilis]|uniref:Endonuclease/exonuclease/phosphatase n=1 Tax=Crepidotus variabilis TaxID=179855 RepID=A0A9P6ELK2_9AGAR|nr:Endonuclease/exonuclease/phosphatase [Crepidotus variabilis]
MEQPSSSGKARQLTGEQLAKAQARKEKKLNQQQTNKSKIKDTTLDPRSWLTLPKKAESQSQVKILSWNLLAQCLIRRELFPASDCLKAQQREPLIHEEILRQNADILCLQEVDRLEKLLPLLQRAGYSERYASGPGKKHGCLVAFKKDLYTLFASKTIYYDDEDVDVDTDEPRRRSSFRTRNVANLVALKRNDHSRTGLIVATTHLFWHPRYTYERTRQVYIMFKETLAFREEQFATDWRCILAGDFNFTPSDATYSLLFKEPLLETQEETITASRVVHFTVDSSVLTDTPSADTAKAASAEDDEEGNPARTITKARPAQPEDGLLTIPQITALFNTLPKPRSLYAEGIKLAKAEGATVHTFGERTGLSEDRQGFMEPEYTSYTFYWKNVLDYIFIIDPNNLSKVTGLLEPPTTKDLDPGIPKTRISGSDHTVMVAEIS